MGDKNDIKILAISMTLLIFAGCIAPCIAIAAPTINASDGSAFSNTKLRYPVNIDTIERVYPLDTAAKEKLFENGFVVP